MSWRVNWTKSAIEETKRLDRRTRERIFRTVERFAESMRGDIRRIQDRESELALRVGKWRAFFEYVHEERGAGYPYIASPTEGRRLSYKK